jgi:uncharacterized integral membrane protein
MSMDWKEHDRNSEAPQGEKSKISPALIAWLVIAILAVVFILQNTKNAKVTFLFWDGTVSIWIVIVIAIVLGVALDRLATWFVRRRRRAA